MGDNAVDKFRKAIDSKDWRTLRTFYKGSNIQPYDYEYVADELLRNKWILTDVVAVGKLDLTKVFFEKAGDSISVNDAGEYGRTGLHRAACDSDIDQVKFLLEHNADPNSMCDSRHTPLYYAYFEHYKDDENHGLLLEIMKILIDAGAKAITTRDNINYLQVRSALMDGNLESVEFVLNLDIDLRAHYFNGNTVLHYLARNEHAGVFAKIHGRDYDVNARNFNGETPLRVAAGRCKVETFKFLLSEGADVNAVDADNCTPVWVAMEKYEDSYGDRSMECIKLLLEHGADIQVVQTYNDDGDHGDDDEDDDDDDDSPTTVFDIIFESYDYANKLVLYKLMLEHLALQEANGVRIIEIIQSEIDSEDQLKQYFSFCKELLAKKVHESKMLLELLSCKEEKLVPLMRNADFVQIVENFSDELESQTVFYGDWLRKRLDKANRTAKLRDSAAIVISKLMKIEYDSYFFIVDLILRCLKDQDLNMLLNISF